MLILRMPGLLLWGQYSAIDHGLTRPRTLKLFIPGRIKQNVIGTPVAKLMLHTGVLSWHIDFLFLFLPLDLSSLNPPLRLRQWNVIDIWAR